MQRQRDVTRRLVSLIACLAWLSPLIAAEAPLIVGFGEVDITPPLIPDKPLYIAGYAPNRRATAIHDPLFARAVVLRHADTRLALVSIDVVGLFYHRVERIREKLPGFEVVVSSTHNHEAPDTLGLWGPNPFTTGVDPAFLDRIEAGIVNAVTTADAAGVPAEVEIGTAGDPDLLSDSRPPLVKHDTLTALRFLAPRTKTPVGILVQWNCHPEALGSKNTEISSDYVGFTVAALKKKHGCPVVYFTGTVGGLMAPVNLPAREKPPRYAGAFERTEIYGKAVAALADRALDTAKPVTLTPIQSRRSVVYLPVDNPVYQAGWKLGILDRPIWYWSDNPTRGDPIEGKRDPARRLCTRSEVGLLRLGEVEVACIPGEIYPELVLSQVDDPADPNADFPDAPIEPGIYAQLKAKHRMILGLANDEIGYIIPRRQWDQKPPFTHGLKKPPYGEINSLGPETAPILCEMFRKLAAER